MRRGYFFGKPRIKESYFDAATEWDLTAAKHVLRREAQKLSLLECRLEIYTYVSLPLFILAQGTTALYSLLARFWAKHYVVASNRWPLQCVR